MAPQSRSVAVLDTGRGATTVVTMARPTRIVHLRLWLSVLVVAIATVAVATRAHATWDGFGADTGGAGWGWVTGGSALVETSLVLGQVDLLSGSVIGDGTVSSLGESQYLAATLSDTAQLAFDAQRAADAARERAEARRATEAARLASAARLAGSQTEIGPDGCPVTVPTRTLRGGADTVGAYELCVRSVAQAPTAQAAVAIKFAFTNLGVPYSQPQRMQPGYYDCSSFVSAAYAAAGVPTLEGGWAPTTRQLAPYPGYRSYPWLTSVPYEQRLPGDLTLTGPTRADGGGHVMMQLADGFMVHTATRGDVSHITAEWPARRIEYTRRVTP